MNKKSSGLAVAQVDEFGLLSLNDESLMVLVSGSASPGYTEGFNLSCPQVNSICKNATCLNAQCGNSYCVGLNNPCSL